MVKNFKYILITLIFILAVVLFTSTVDADFQIGNASHSIEGVYGPSEDIKGWINISLNNEPTNSLFQDSRNNSIKLINLLKNNTDYTYSCDPSDCSTDYTASNGETSKTTNINLGTSKLYGLRFTGNLVAINSVDFTLESDASVACTSQIEIDVLDDGNIDFVNNKIGEGAGCDNLKRYSCYNPSLNNEEYTIGEVPFCQKIKLSESPGFIIGAWIKNFSGSLDLKAELYDQNGGSIGDCTLPAPTTSGGEISCSIDYSLIEEEDHYVCIYSAEGSGEYKIRGNSDPEEGCGFYGLPIQSNTPGAYQIFAEGRKFDAVGTLSVTNSLPGGNTLGALVHDYILEKYGSFDCSSECTVPIRFISNINQQVTLNNLVVDYEKDAGPLTENRFYDLSEIPATVASSFQKFFLDKGGFSVPSNLGDYEFSLKLNNNEILSEEVRIEDIPKILSLRPVSTASAYPTEFVAGVESSRNISKYFWDFGDGDSEVTLQNKVTHTYPVRGSYDLTLTVTDSSEYTSSRTFKINVSSPKNLINDTIKKIRSNIENVKLKISNFNLFAQESINSILRIDNISQEVDRLEEEFNAAQSETEYNMIISNLIKLNMPGSVAESVKAESISFTPNVENIDVGILGTISGGAYDSSREEDYINAVILWNRDNVDAKIDFSEFVGEYETSTEPILRVFEIDIKEKRDLGYTYYLILPELNNLEFGSNVLKNEEGGYVYIELNGDEKIYFSTTEDVDFIDIPGFISPGVSRLSLAEPGSVESDEKRSRITIFILAISLLIIAAFITYIILQQWYKKRYEDYLFKNKNDLYNLVHYINNAKKRGFKNKEIRENLKKARWSSEQIRYVMRKYGGKRTGMFELPLTNILSKVEKKDQRRK